MKLCRFSHAGKVGVGEVENDRIRVHGGDRIGASERTGETILLEQVRLLAPVMPGKIVAIGQNYSEHARELGHAVTPEPLIFLKPPSAVLDPGGTIVMPRASQRVDYEAELGVVIGRTAHNLRDDEDPLAYVLGYCCVNDVTARDLQKKDVQFTRGKGFDTFCPMGPWIETHLDPGAVRVRSRVNGQVRQDGITSDMIFNVPCLIRYISGIMTLQPGDLIATGTPAGVGPLAEGDIVEIEVEGIGVLRNPVGR
jgi:2-keto-4-pentenoate hydratase/2-oxohepta-3-ene-1,7-dioic acid hydratase in catechol pathway